MRYAQAAFVREYIALCERRADELRELYSFLSFAEGELKHSLKPIPEICEGFEGKMLSECGFLRELAEGGAPEARLVYIEGEAREHLREFFSHLGSGYSDEEIARLMRESEYIENCHRTAREAARKNKRLLPIVFTLVFTLILFLII